MNDQRKRLWLFSALLVLLAGVIFLMTPDKKDAEPYVEVTEDVSDLDRILERGVLRATTNYNSTNYFIYRGEPMGFHLEMLRLFSAHLGVELEVYVSNSLDENFDCLLNGGGCDILAMDLTRTGERSRQLQFTVPHTQTRQMLVQRRAAGAGSLVRNQLDLAGKTVHVQRNTAYVNRLRNMMEEIGDTIYIIEMDHDVEQLIEMVALGEIDFTVSDEHLARLNSHFFTQLDMQTPLSFPQHLSWAVRPGSSQLLEEVNAWMRDFTSTRQYAILYNKYYNNPRSVFMARSSLHSQGGGNISAFDDYFRKYADIVGWDWRLIASLAYQESRFDPEAVSWAGAFGLMQLMPGTAEAYQIEPDSPVPEHIHAGVSYLRWIDEILSQHIEDEQERVKFVLAAYNMGVGHVLDARRLAIKYGRDPNIWRDNVDYFVLNKSRPKYYQDEVVRFGYARGTEPYRYVNEILERWAHYRNALES